MSTPLRPGEVGVTWRYETYHPGEDEPFTSVHSGDAQILAIQLTVSLTRDDVDRIEIVRCPTVELAP